MDGTWFELLICSILRLVVGLFCWERVVSSVVEHLIYTEGVAGSIPAQLTWNRLGSNL